MRFNFLFSATRQWNPGDEFILFGTINLLKSLDLDFNPIILNRHPGVWKDLIFKGHRLNIRTKEGSVTVDLGDVLSVLPFFDNSFNQKEDSLDHIDMVIFSGTPEWWQFIIYPFFRKLTTFKKPIVFLGIGLHIEKERVFISDDVKKCLEKASLITTRDSATYELLRDYGAIKSVCPALFASIRENVRKTKEKIGLVVQIPDLKHGQRVEKKFFDVFLKLYKKIHNKYDVYFLCHYAKEVEYVYKAFEGKIKGRIFYSFDAKDYLDLYDNFDLVVTTRVHAGGLASSLGIPNVVIHHSPRSETVKGFLSEVFVYDDEKSVNKNAEALAGLIEDLNVEEVSQKIISHKREKFQENKELLADRIGDYFS